MKRERTCIACRKTGDKRGFLRIAKLPDGRIVFDETGRGAGRGAYACSAACFVEAVRKNRFPRALRCACPASELEAAGRKIEELEGSQGSMIDEEW